jgi:hypothetical protein
VSGDLTPPLAKDSRSVHLIAALAWAWTECDDSEPIHRQVEQ